MSKNGCFEMLCKGCKKNTPESMKSFIDEDVSCEDEVYYCFWCNFIQSTGIDESIMKQKADSAKATRHGDYEVEDDGSYAMWELEDTGAFSDEGIMPGCHSRDWEYESEARGIAKEFADMEFVGMLLKTAREKIQLSTEELAKRVNLPESFIHDVELGQYINRYGNMSVMPEPVPVLEKIYDEKKDEKREWWQDYSDSQISEKIADYLSYVINPPVYKKHIPDDFEQGLYT